MPPFDSVIADPAGLADLYRQPSDLVKQKKRAGIDPGSARFIGLSPFVLVATVGADGGADVSPRGGDPGFVRVHHTDPDHGDGADYVLLPDLNGNNLIDTLRAVVATGAAGLLFIVPGKDETLRVNGPAWVVTDDAVLDRFDEFRRPKAAIAVRADEVFVHCAKAFRRGRVWDPEAWAELAAAPDLADMLCESGVLPGVDPELIRADLAEGYARGLAEDRPAPA
jgi:PPOX class probable FMN-dependent enzyme